MPIESRAEGRKSVAKNDDRQLESSVRFNSFQAKPDGPGSVPPETRGRPSRSNFRATLKAWALEASVDGFWATVDSSRSSALRRRRGIEKPPQETFAPLQVREQETGNFENASR